MDAKVKISNVYFIKGIGGVPVGFVTEGTLKIGMKISINGEIIKIINVEMNHEKVESAPAGNNVGFSLSGGDKEMIESLKEKDIFFTDDDSKIENYEYSAAPTKSVPRHPKGAFHFITKWFK